MNLTLRGTLVVILVTLPWNTSVVCGATNCSAQEAVCAPPSVRSPLGAQGDGSHAYPRTVYCEHSGQDGQEWGERINTAIQTAMLSSTVVLPLGTFAVKTPIMVWMLRNDSAGVDTRSLGVPLARLGDAWAAISGGTPQDTSQGLTIEGQGGGGQAGQLTTKMVWNGAEDQVMIDIPSPWSVTLRRFMLDGSYTPRLIGVRYRAGYSFGVNGGKSNLFERLSLHGFDVAVDVGGPLLPDLVATRFSQLTITDARIAMRFFGANVAGQWVSDLWVNNYTEAGIKLQGYGVREARLHAMANATGNATATSSGLPPLTDADGDEIFFEQIPAYAQKMRMLPCPPYCSPGPEPTRRQAGGGGPSVMVSNVVSSSSNRGSWLVDSNGPALHLSHVRLEGNAGIYRNTGLWGAPEGSAPTSDGRFMSVLIDVSNSYSAKLIPAHGDAIYYSPPAQLYLLSCSVGANISLGSNATAIDLGTRFSLPDGTPSGRFVQLPGTKGAGVSGLSDRRPLTPMTPTYIEDHTTVQRVAQLEATVAMLVQQLGELKAQIKIDDAE